MYMYIYRENITEFPSLPMDQKYPTLTKEPMSITHPKAIP